MRKAVIVAASLILLPVPQAFAHFAPVRPSAPDRTLPIACRMVAQNTGGVMTTRRVCDAGPAANANCPLVTKRIVKAGGEVVLKTRRQCS